MTGSDASEAAFPAVLSLENIHKAFGGAPALRGVRLEAHPGEIHGLIGENGAGKSTLINIATGVLSADQGTLTFQGQPATLSGPRHAAALGIAVVHQESDLFPQLSIAENMLLGQGLVTRASGWIIDWPGTFSAAGRLVEAMGERFDVRAPAAGLTVARRMMAEISAAVSANARVLFLDEPTASLTLKETENLFAQIRRLREAGVGIVYVSHRLEEILTLCDRVTVMRDGETIETRPASEYTMDRMVAAMVGRQTGVLFDRPPSTVGTTRLVVENLSDTAGQFRGVSFDARAGEILGVYGFVGAGRSETAQALFGLRPVTSGRVRVDGKEVGLRTPRAAMEAGLAYLPEDRLVQGIFRTHSLRKNGSVAVLPRLSTLGWINQREERGTVRRMMADMRVRAQNAEQAIGTLSGGNQQKVVFGRWGATNPKVLILDEPTRGVDVGAKAEIHKLISDMAQQGAAVVMISSELPEIMAMSDRVLTMSAGQVTGVFDPKTDSEAVIAAAAVPRSTNDAKAERADTPPSRLHRLLHFREAGLAAFILLLAGAMALLRPEQFATPSNLIDILENAALPAIMALGAMLIICAGGIDISVGSMMGLVAAAAGMAAKSGAPPLVCLALAMTLGMAFSLANAGTSLLARIHPIIVTLAGISIYRGLMRNLTGGHEVLQLPDAYAALAAGTWGGIPKICVYVIVITLIIHLLLRYSLWGRRVLALGNSETASRLIGLSKAKLTLSVFAVSGLLTGITSVLHSGYYAGVQANTGEGMELRAIAAAVIGGTNIMGGRGSALGTLFGAVLVALLYNCLILMKISEYWQNVFVGGLILAAVLADAALQRLRGKAAA